MTLCRSTTSAFTIPVLKTRSIVKIPASILVFGVLAFGIIFFCISNLQKIDSHSGRHIRNKVKDWAGQKDDKLSDRQLKTEITDLQVSGAKENMGRYISGSIVNCIEYGSPLNSVNRTPVVMARLKLGESVHRQLLQYPMFSCNESTLDQGFDGLDNRVKIPIYIYEGYYHSLLTKEKIFSRNPNPLIGVMYLTHILTLYILSLHFTFSSTGVDFMKPAAADFIRAFYESFRRVNRDIFDTLKDNLISSALRRLPSHPERDVCCKILI